jgi:hypothetical protein
MGQQNLSFVEKHIEKVVLGVGGVLALASMALMVKWAVGDSGLKPGEISRQAAELKRKVESSAGPVTATPWAPAVSRVDLAAAAPSLPAYGPEGAVGRLPTPRYPELPRPGTGKIDTTKVESKELETLPSPLPAPTRPQVSVLRGAAAKPVFDGAAVKWDKQFDEIPAGVFLQFSFNQRQILESWWPIYDFSVIKQEEIRRRLVRPNLDFKAAAKEFLRRWDVKVMGIETQMQRFVPGAGWEKDWQDIDRPYGAANDSELLSKLRSAKLPDRNKRKDSADLKARFDDTRRGLGELYGQVQQDVEWPVPPGPPPVGAAAGAARLQLFDARGNMSRDRRPWWPQRPQAAVVAPGSGVDEPRKVEDKDKKTPTKPKGSALGGDDEDEDKRPVEKEKVEVGVVKADDGRLELDRALGAKVAGLGGPDRHLCSLVLGGNWGNKLLPGEVYRFRVRYVVMNPVLNWDKAAPGLENVLYFESEWSPPTEPVFVPDIHQFFITGVQFANNQRRPTVQLWRWHEGTWYNTRHMPVNIGETVRVEREIDLKGKGNVINIEKVGGKDAAVALFDTGCAVVDIQEVPALQRKPLAGAQPFKPHNVQTIRITYQDAKGNLHHRYQAYDKDDSGRWQIAAGTDR